MGNPTRSFSRDIFLKIFGSIARPNKGIYILNSHLVSPKHPTYEMYCEFLAFLAKNCQLIKIGDAVALIKDRKIVNNCLVAFTFDDGFEECHTFIAPALEEFKINGAFFINGNFIECDAEYKEKFAKTIVDSPGKLPMSWLEIKNLQNRGHVIGSHTLDHVNLNSNNYEYIEFQIAENKKLIEKRTAQPCEYFAFPFGQLKYINNESIKIIEKYHTIIFGVINYKKYFSFNEKVLNRRHIECWWPKSHINYFLSARRKY